MGIIDIGLWFAYILISLAIASAVVLPLVNAAKSPGSFKKSLIGVGAMVVLFVVSYALTGSDVTIQQKAAGVTENTSKLIGAGLTMFYLVFVVAVVGMIYSEIHKALK
jgi:hypothetical protein